MKQEILGLCPSAGLLEGHLHAWVRSNSAHHPLGALARGRLRSCAHTETGARLAGWEPWGPTAGATLSWGSIVPTLAPFTCPPLAERLPSAEGPCPTPVLRLSQISSRRGPEPPGLVRLLQPQSFTKLRRQLDRNRSPRPSRPLPASPLVILKPKHAPPLHEGPAGFCLNMSWALGSQNK